MNTLAKIATTNLALAALVAALAGCKSDNYNKGNDTASGLQASADQVGIGQTKIDTVVSNLNALVNSPTNLPAQFATYGTSVDDLEATAQKFRGKVDAMRAKGGEYFTAWDAQVAQIQNEDIKSRSIERKNKLTKEFSDIQTSYTEAADAFKPFMANLKDIRTALATDLNPDGVKAIKSTADKTTKMSADVKESLAKLAAEFKELGVALAATAPPAPPAAPAK